MNPGIPCNSLSSLIATAGLVGLMILAPTAHASDQSLGAVSFANSGSPAAQADFLTGLAQLHNFQYRQAAEARLLRTLKRTERAVGPIHSVMCAFDPDASRVPPAIAQEIHVARPIFFPSPS
jgi:hypothetical protein